MNKKTKKSKILDKLHQVREENYKKTKYMTSREYVLYISATAKEAARRLGIFSLQ